MKFFDLGARHGEAYEQLRRNNYLVDTGWMVGIEGNPEISTVPEHYDEWIRAAAWVKEGWADYCAGAAWSVSSGLAGHNCLESDDKQTMHRVWTIDFPALIAREKKCDIKLDVETAEWELLPALFPYAGRIRRLFIEWHFNLGHAKTEAERIEEQYRQAGVEVLPWR